MTVIPPPRPATPGMEMQTAGEAAPPPPAEAAVPVAPPPPEARRLRRVAIGLAAVALVFTAWEALTSFVAYTDDAYVRSDLVSVAPEVTGHIVEVAVVDNQTVHRHDLLARIDPVPFQLTLDAKQATLSEATAQAGADTDAIAAARAELAAANATLADARTSESRINALARDDFASRQAHDDAEEALNRARAAVDAAEAALARAQALLGVQQSAIARARADLAIAQWQFDRTEIRAPVDGTVNNLDLQVGDTAHTDTALIGIVAAHAWRVIANYKQDFLGDLHEGQTAWVWLDSHPGHFYRARISGIGRGISREPGERGLLPYVAPTTDWIRLQRRFPVTINLVDPPADLTLYSGADARTLIFP
jgi:membrane fusion protein, multidrug efflux system